MANLPEPLELDHTFELFVPTQCRCGKMLPEQAREEVLDEIKAKMSEWFGGTTTKQGEPRVEKVEGAYKHERGELAKEVVDVVTSFATAEHYAEHREEFAVYVAQLANRLTQETMACRIGEKTLLFPATDAPKSPCHCMDGKLSGGLPTPLQPDELARMRALQACLQRISSVRDARDLFCNVLHYGFEDEQLAMVSWPDKLKEFLAPRTAPRIIANQNGFKILYVQLADESLRKGNERLLIQRIIKDDPTLRGLVVVSDIEQQQWHLVNAEFVKEEGKKERLRLRRMRVGKGQSVRTAVERLSMVDIETAGEETSAADLQDLHNRAFDVESVSKEFFKEISNWYFWALSEVKFPTDVEDDNEQYRATSTIRLLTRIIFCWFLKKREFVPENLFREKDLDSILIDINPDSSTYYQGILQNLFFATLNQRMGKDSKGKPYRAFAKDEGFHKNKSTYGVDTLYRYEELFQDPDTALTHFRDVPFLNGGLFECLDRTEEKTNRKLYIDGFSRNKKKRARVPNRLFFAREHAVDLSGAEAYGQKKYKNVPVRGLLRILHAYNFTIEENTPVDEEIALDPELLGKVFENLLASYNPETKITARKQTGSFYTPRHIVEYMVDESLKAHLTAALTGKGRAEKEAREQLDILLGYADEEPSFSEDEVSALVEAIHTCKILDPACGSGAFPIGMLQKLVHILQKLDPDNDKFEAIQIAEAQKIEERAERRKRIEQIGRDFSENKVDYGRKLYLIENCLYGVDIQPIAIQIAKLRFFITLICDQRENRDQSKNHSIRALPNLETKFVAANTLIGIPKLEQLELVDSRVYEIEAEIESLYHRHFTIQRRRQKIAIQKKLKELREELGRVLAESLGSSKKAERLAEWDPFDPQASSGFFDPNWMFGRSLANGFDIIIGNPPYLESRSPAFSSSLKDSLQRAVAARWPAVTVSKCVPRGSDLLIYFLEASVYLAKKSGNVVLITQNAWLDTEYGKTFQEFILGKTHVSMVIDSDFKHFDSKGGPNINTVITFFRGRRPEPEKHITFARFHERLTSGIFPAMGEKLSREVDGATYRQYPYDGKVLRTTKWGILLSADDVVLDLLAELQEKAVTIKEIPSGDISIGQGLNLKKDYFVSTQKVSELKFLRKALLPIHTAADGAPFCIQGTHLQLVNKQKLCFEELKLLGTHGINAFDPDSTSKLPPVLVMPRGIGRYFCALNPAKAYSSSGVDIYFKGKHHDEATILNLWAVLNSSVAWLLREATGRKNLGGGMLKAEAVDLKSLPLYMDLGDINEIKKVAKALTMREAKNTVDELETPEHKKLDELVFNYLNADSTKRKQVLNSLRQKINARIHKSRT